MHGRDAGTGKRPARWHTVTDTRLSITVPNVFGVSVSTIEHLIAAYYACGVDNCRILIDDPEVSIMGGSAKSFIAAIKNVGLIQQLAERRATVITKPIWIYGGEKHAVFWPLPQQWFDMTTDFESNVIGKQNYSMPLNEHFFESYIAQARTFGFENQMETLEALDLAQDCSLKKCHSDQ